MTQYWVINNLPLHVKWPVASDLRSFDQLIHKICVTWLRSTQVTNIPTNFEVDISMQHWKTLSQTLELLVRLLAVAMATTTQLRSASVWGWLNHPVLSYDVSCDIHFDLFSPKSGHVLKIYAYITFCRPLRFSNTWPPTFKIGGPIARYQALPW